METGAWVTVGVVASILGLMAFTRFDADLILLGGLIFLLVTGVIDPKHALEGFANEGVITVAVLYIVVAGLRDTGVISYLAQRFLGWPKTVAGAQLRILLPVVSMSAFVNNTPVVAMWLPVIDEWCKKFRLPASKLMIPLSYAAILGGCCTLIGTSTNLIVNGLLIAAGHPGLKMFDLVWVGLPCAAAGVLYLLLFSRWLLPDRRPAISRLSDPREYTTEMLVEPGGPLIGKTIEEAGLRHLPGMYLMEIDRDDQVLAAVSSRERLKANDRLVFVGIVESVVDLQKIRGLKPATDQIFKIDVQSAQRTLIEAVVSNTCPLIGITIREGRFRTVYNAAVIAVARNGERIRKKIGDIVLVPGDTLLLEAHPSFVTHQRNSRDFYLVSRVEDYVAPRHEQIWMAGGIFFLMVLAASFGWPMLNAAFMAAALMVLTRCLGSSAWQSIDWQVVAAIAASFGIGRALEVTGAAKAIAGALVGLGGGSPLLTLALVYGVTLLFTELMSNNAAAVLVFPIAMAAARSINADIMPFMIALMMAASFGFATPMGYQTHLMVYGPGGYRFADFLRVGLPLDLLLGVVTVAVTPHVWPINI